MRRALSLLLAAALALAPLTALGAETGWMVLDMEDFTIGMPENAIHLTYEKKNGQVCLLVYPDFHEDSDFNTAFNVVWTEDTEDWTQVGDEERQTIAGQVMGAAAEGLEAQGITVNAAELIRADVTPLDGVPAFAMVYSLELDYSTYGVDLQLTLYFFTCVAVTETGSWTFTGSADSLEALTEQVDPMVSSVRWTR